MRRETNFHSYVIAVLWAGVAVALNQALAVAVGVVTPTALFAACVIFSALYGGFLPGLTTTAVLLLVALVRMDPFDKLQQINLVVFLATSVVSSLAIRELRTAQLKAEVNAASARAAQQSLNAVLESTLDAVVSLDSELRCRYVNENACRLVGRKPSELIGKTLWEFFPQFRGSTIEAVLQGVADKHSLFRFEERDPKSGRWFECSMSPADDGMNLFLRDVTEHKAAEALIETDHDRLATTLHDLPVAVLIVSRDMVVETANPRANQLFGRELRPGTDFRTISAGAARNPEVDLSVSPEPPLIRTLREGCVVSNLEVQYERPDGVILALILNSIPLKASDGSVRAALATYSDVTSLHKAQAALAASEHRRRYLFNSPSMGVFSGENEHIEDANPAFLEMIGYSTEEFLAGRLRWPEITAPEFASRDQQAQAEIIEKGFCDPYEKEFIARDGRRVPVLIGAVSASPGTWTPWVVWVLDLSERRRLEERLRQTARLESVGLLAGGVAHDFNNLLTGILGNTSLAAERLPAGDETRELIEHAIRITERVADLTRQLLAYAGKGQFVVGEVDLSALVQETFEFVKGSIPRHVRCNLQLSPCLPLVEADATQIQQIVMNLIINAGEAIGDATGQIDIATGTIEVDQAWLRKTSLDNQLVPGNYCYIRVEDNGRGMDETTRRRIFDPFFTTKFTGRGLGLAAALGIARGHYGAIEVTTTPGAGSSFSLLLPRRPQAPQLVPNGVAGESVLV